MLNTMETPDLLNDDKVPRDFTAAGGRLMNFLVEFPDCAGNLMFWVKDDQQVTYFVMVVQSATDISRATILVHNIATIPL